MPESTDKYDTESERWDNLVDSIPAAVWQAEPETFRLTFISRYAEALFGYPLHRWTDQPSFWDDHIFWEDRAPVLTQRRKAIRESMLSDLEYRIMSAQGQALWVREVCRTISAEGPHKMVVGMFVDLSKKRSANEALSRNKRWLRQVIDTIPQQIWSGPADGTLDFCNARWRSELGLTLEELEGDGWQKTLHPEDRDAVLKSWRESIVTGNPYEREERHRMAEGQYRWFLSRGVALRDERGAVQRWYGTNTDIDRQKKAEEERRRSQQRWRAVFDNTRVGVALLDFSLHFVEVNAAYENLAGYPMKELLSMTCADVTAVEDWLQFQTLENELRNRTLDRFELETRYRQRDGGVRCVRVNASLVRGEFGESDFCVMMVEDITDRKRLGIELERERDRLRLLLDLNHSFISKLELPSVIEAVLAGLHQRDHWDWTTILLPEPATNRFRVYLEGGGDRSVIEDQHLSLEGTIADSVYRTGEPMVFRSGDLHPMGESGNSPSWLQQVIREKNLIGGCVLPLVQDSRVLGLLFLATRTDRELAISDLDYLQELARLIAAALSNALRYGEVTSSCDKLASQTNYAEEQIRAALGFENIIGHSKALAAVLQHAETVASTDSTVLILGETGTGKELIARAIHDRSHRRGQAFIKIDCAAIPESLLESELFGHEKGAFTGAIARKLGRLEVADKGTLFLDEVGEIPLALQTKLLRVLQDQTLERLGSNRTVRLDVRVIAATHRNLGEMVRQGTFRADLYYRLKVFPILIPALRDRREDIPDLVRYYTLKYAQRMKKSIDVIPAAAMEIFRRYPWPGNIRELQHFIERSVILTPGNTLKAPLGELEEAIRNPPEQENSVGPGRTMEEIERDSILSALKASNWVVGGPNVGRRKSSA